MFLGHEILRLLLLAVEPYSLMHYSGYREAFSASQPAVAALARNVIQIPPSHSQSAAYSQPRPDVTLAFLPWKLAISGSNVFICRNEIFSNYRPERHYGGNGIHLFLVQVQRKGRPATVTLQPAADGRGRRLVVLNLAGLSSE